ncbi:Elongation factor 1-beta [Choanephora cucurbitarum]|uniref:Elongation factor 1-beta n=2 Tax=Choanephora cucurbitarum TaxID=101091 RepID=A0A1C7NPX0_9FUNG|nr:Elongation factor 1-beta [Choanephora cucurbitarum]
MSVTLELPLALHILEAVLAENKFVASNDKATEADAAVAKALGSAPAAEFANVNKWYSEVKPSEAAPAEEDEDDIDLFGSDDEEVDEEAERVKAQRIAEYNAKKANKPKTIAKTTVTLDVKPWDDETNMEELTKAVKEINQDGLLWGGHQLVAIGYGIKKLQINCVVEDDKVLMDDLTEQILALEDYVQSVDIAAMQKI